MKNFTSLLILTLFYYNTDAPIKRVVTTPTAIVSQIPGYSQVIPNALNIGLSFSTFNLSSTAQMYIFNEARTVLDSAIIKSKFTYSTSIGIAPFKSNSIIIYIVEPGNFGTLQTAISIQNLEAGLYNQAGMQLSYRQTPQHLI